MILATIPMKYVLRNTSTGRFLKRPGLWVAGLDDAMTFEDMMDVREYCQAHQLENVQPIQRLMPYLTSLLRNDASAPGS
jgi:hypothetical protein